jgi:hypothetical protein
MTEQNPYVGPRPFERADSSRFFGRTQEANELLSLVVANRATLLYAQSGAGKTSLINAQVITLLEAEGFDVFNPARVYGPMPEGVTSDQISNIYIFNTFLNWDKDEADVAALTKLTKEAYLAAKPRVLDEYGLPKPRVLIIDQLEELFTTYPQRWRDRENFFYQISRALAADSTLRVIFSMREDYVAQLDPYVSLLPRNLRAHFRLERMRPEAALIAVRGPLRATNREFAAGVAEELVENLRQIRVESLAGDITSVVGEFIEPVQLQVVCQNLWRDLPADVTTITSAHLQVYGDVSQALSQFYERVVQQTVQDTAVPERYLREWFTNELITPAGTRSTVYRGAQETGGIANEAVQVMENAHLIRGEYRAGSRWYELTHDTLIEPIQKSNEQWLEQNENPLRLASQIWNEHNKSNDYLLRGQRLKEAQNILDSLASEATGLEKEFINTSLKYSQQIRARRLTLLLAVAVVVTFMLVGLSIFALTQRSFALNAQTVAEAARNSAIQERRTAEAASTRAFAEKAIAEAERDTVGTLVVNLQTLLDKQSTPSQPIATDFTQTSTLTPPSSSDLTPGSESATTPTFTSTPTPDATVQSIQEQLEQIRVTQAVVAATAQAQTESRDRVRPLHPGISIGGINSSMAGTLGAIVWNADGRLFVLSTGQILGIDIGTSVLQPGPVDGGKDGTDNIATLSQFRLDDSTQEDITSLIGLARLEDTIPFELLVPEIGSIRGAGEPEVGMNVWVIGRTSGLQMATIAEVNSVSTMLVNMPGRATQSIQFANGFTIALPNSPIQTPFSFLAPGDEGALVLDEEGFAVGIIVGLGGMAAPMRAILDRFDVDFPLAAISYSQNDPRWKDRSIGFDKFLFSENGTLLTCFAMMLFNFGENVNPLTLNDRFMELPDGQGFLGSHVYFAAPAYAYNYVRYLGNYKPSAETGATFATHDPNLLERIDQGLMNAQGIIAQVDLDPTNDYDPTTEQHWVLILERQGDDYLIIDPIDGVVKLLLPRYGAPEVNPSEALNEAIKSVLFYRE